MGLSVASMPRIPVFNSLSSSPPVSPSEGDLWYSTDTKIWKSYDGSAWNTLGASNVSVLGDGVFTSQSTDVGYEQAGTFSIPEDLEGGIIYVDIISKSVLGAGTSNSVALDHLTAQASSPFISSNALNPYIRLRITQNAVNTAFVDAQKWTTAGYSEILGNSEFNTSAAETFFVNCKANSSGNQIKLAWVAYLIK